MVPLNKVLCFECSEKVQEHRLMGAGYVDPQEVEEEKANIVRFFENTMKVVLSDQKGDNLVTISDNVDQEQSYPQAGASCADSGCRFHHGRQLRDRCQACPRWVWMEAAQHRPAAARRDDLGLVTGTRE